METYHGHVRTPADAIILFEACRLGLLPRVQRRLSEKERQSIKSGSVFVWDEREAGMRRWTDGKSWSASRVSGSFLTYREMEGKRGGSHASSRANKTPESTRGSDEDQGEGGEEGPDGYRYKPDGLMKQSFSITTSAGQHLHLISYYARSHPNAPGLNQPSTDPQLRHIRPQKGLYPESSVNDQQNLPVVTRGPMGGAPLAVPPALAYGRSPHYPPPPYGWPGGPVLGAPHVSVIPYVANYLPPLGAGGHAPYAYGHHPGYPPPHPGYSPYDRMMHPSEQAAMHPPILNGAPTALHAIPYYGHGHSPMMSHHDIMNPHSRDTRRTRSPEFDPRAGSSRAEHIQGSRNGSQPNQSPSKPASVTSPLINGTSNGIRKRSEPTSPANIVPSINSLMNSVQAPLDTAPRPPSNPDTPKSVASQHHQDYTSAVKPINGQVSGVEGPKDIPSEKISFGEDMRALRQLDRVFSA